jgi:hypothetical protein
LVWSPESDLLAIVWPAEGLEVWRGDTLEPVLTRRFATSVSAPAFSPDGRQVAVGLGDGRVFVVTIP